MPDPEPSDRHSPKKSPVDTDGFRVFVLGDEDRDRFEKNLVAFRKYAPWLMPKLNAVKGTATHLVVDDDGDFDIAFQNEKFFQGGSKKWAAERVENFENKPDVTRLTAAPMDSGNLDDVANDAIYRTVKRCVDEHGIAFAQGAVDVTCYHMVVLGVGLADHLPLIVERTDCQNLILFEPNFEFIYHSLFTFDWVGLFAEYETPGKRIWLFHEQIPIDIALRMRDSIRLMGSHFAEGTFLLQSYPSTLLKQAINEILADANLIVAGMGFLEDEFDMVRNSYNNLLGFAGQYYHRREEAVYMPAFVIGSGPSLDMDLPYLKANQDRALVVSCGTTLRILLNNGIMPDIHVEMENVPVVATIMETLSKDHDLSSITLVAANTIDPGVKDYFDRVIFFIRPSLTSSKLFDLGEDAAIEFPSPTVANLGFSLACELGFQSVYLFGVDLGARNPNSHHASGAIYETGVIEAGVSAEDIQIPVAANFGGTIFSEYVYLWSKDMIENKAARYQGRRQFYNCSDGIRIVGILPKLSATIKLPEQTDKKSVIDPILASFPTYSQEHFNECWDKLRLRNDIRTFRNTLLECCGYPPIDDFDEDASPDNASPGNASPDNSGTDTKNTVPDAMDFTDPANLEITDLGGKHGPTGPSEYKAATANEPAKHKSVASGDLDYLVDITRHLIARGEETTTEIHFYRGSIFMMMTAINFFTVRVPKGEKRSAVSEIGRQETADQITKIASFILWFYDYMDGVVDTPPPVGAYKDIAS
jgi:hypothetical protein